MRKSRSLSLLIFVVILGIGVALAYGMHSVPNKFVGIWTQRGKRWIFETKTYPNVHQGELRRLERSQALSAGARRAFRRSGC